MRQVRFVHVRPMPHPTNPNQNAMNAASALMLAQIDARLNRKTQIQAALKDRLTAAS